MADTEHVLNVSVLPYHEQLQDQVQAAVDGNATAEQSRGALPSPQLHVTGRLRVHTGTVNTHAHDTHLIHIHNTHIASDIVTLQWCIVHISSFYVSLSVAPN